MDKEKTTEQEKSKPKAVKPAKKKMKPRGGNSPMIGMNGYNLEPGDNAKFLAVNVALFNMPNIDKHDVNQVANRLTEFFELYGKNDMKPTVAGMAMSLGWSRQHLWAVAHDAPTGGKGDKSTLPRAVTDCIKKAYFLMENMWETYMNTGKINPMAGVFLGVNNYSYKDVKQVDVAPVLTNNTDNDYDVAAIRERYIVADHQKQLSDGKTEE